MDEGSDSIDHWDVVIYNGEGEESETLRDLAYGQVDTLLGVFERKDIQAKASAYDENDCLVSGGSFSVNWPST